MNELIEAGDLRTKVVGRRRFPKMETDSRTFQFDRLQDLNNRLWGGLPFPKGVHRFRTEEESEEWKMNLLLRNAPGRRALAI